MVLRDALCSCTSLEILLLECLDRGPWQFVLNYSLTVASSAAAP